MLIPLSLWNILINISLLFVSVCSWRVNASVQRSVASNGWYYNTKSIWSRVSNLKTGVLLRARQRGNWGWLIVWLVWPSREMFFFLVEKFSSKRFASLWKPITFLMKTLMKPRWKTRWAQFIIIQPVSHTNNLFPVAMSNAESWNPELGQALLKKELIYILMFKKAKSL